jgi:hypothetical protein
MTLTSYEQGFDGSYCNPETQYVFYIRGQHDLQQKEYLKLVFHGLAV